MMCVVRYASVVLHCRFAIQPIERSLQRVSMCALVDDAARVNWSVGVMATEAIDGGMLCGVSGGSEAQNIRS